MPSSTTLSFNDSNVLSKINDPESSPSNTLMISDALPRDPHITSPELYQSLARQERDILLIVQRLEVEHATNLSSPSANPNLNPNTTLIEAYQTCITSLSTLIAQHPTYASARNNRAQAYRRIYGDALLLIAPEPFNHTTTTATSRDPSPAALIDPARASPQDLAQAARVILADLTTAIRLLTPRTPFTPISPQAARTLANAFTQRGALFHGAAKGVPEGGTGRVRLRLGCEAGGGDDGESEKGDAQGEEMAKTDLEQLASHDFSMGGRYGNEVARNLAVALNPTAKLCGEMVREAMRKEMMGESS